jgi:hypothetical protein
MRAWTFESKFNTQDKIDAGSNRAAIEQRKMFSSMLLP